MSGGHNVRSTVFIEARSMYRAGASDEMRPVGEVEFVQGLAAASASGTYGPTRAAAAIVGHANLHLGDSVEPVLEALQAASPNRFRGIRHSVTWDANPGVENVSAYRDRHGQLLGDQFRAGARVLARMGMTFDAWLFFRSCRSWPTSPARCRTCRSSSTTSAACCGPAPTPTARRGHADLA